MEDAIRIIETSRRWSSNAELYWNEFLERNTFAVRYFVYLFIVYLLKFYLPLVHKIAFANEFQLNHKIK